jgi:hypothetical protein
MRHYVASRSVSGLSRAWRRRRTVSVRRRLERPGCGGGLDPTERIGTCPPPHPGRSTHLSSGKINANAAWLVLAVIAFNLTRAAATVAGERLRKVTTAMIPAKLVSVPARVATSARRMRLHLPQDWPWEREWTRLFTVANAPPGRAVA